MREKDFQSKLTRWARANLDHSCAIEAKMTKTGRIYARDLQPHQLRALQEANAGTLTFKIPDAGYQNPFDMFVLHKVKAYVAVMFYERGVNHFYLVGVSAWDDAVQDKRSLSESDAAEIGRRCELAAPNPTKGNA